MRILWLAFLYIVSTSAEGYGGSWLEPPSPQAPSFQRPVDAVTDVINELGVRILQEYGESRDNGNVAFSPTGIGFVLAALYEGSAGTGNEQIAHALGLPRDRDITRIGLRDIHRRLRSYLSPDGFLGGLTLNRENTKLRPEYEDILKFLGFDFPSSDDGANATDSTTSIPETISEVPTTPVDSAGTTSSPTSSEASESPVTSMTSTEETTSIVTSEIGDDVTTTTPVPEEDASEASSTSTMKEVTTADTSPEETTTLKRDDDGVVTMGTQVISDPTTTTTSTVEFIEELSSTMEISTAQSTTVSSSTPVLTTTESPTTATVPEVSTGPTEDSSAIPTVTESTESLSSTEPTTMLAMIDAPSTVAKEPEMMSTTTLASMEEVTETTKPESTTLQAEGPVSPGTTTSMVSESSDISTTESTRVTTLDEEESNVEVVDTTEDISEVETSSLNPEESLEELTTTSTEGGSASEPEGTPTNEIVYESTAIPIDTTTVDEINAVETIPNVNETDSESENLLSIEDRNMNAEDTTISSSVGMQTNERRRVRRIGIRDPVIRTLLDTRSAKPEVEVTAKSDLSNSKESGVVWINRVMEYSFTEQNAGESTTKQTSLQKNQSDENIEDFRKLNTREEATIEGETKNRGTRSPRGYFFNVPDFPSFPVYPDFHGFPEETSWTRTLGGWRVHSPKTGEGSRDSSELTFLVNGEVAQVVSAATYTVVLPFAFLPTLQALALEFPLDDPRYNILLLLPTDRDGTRRLARELGNVGLRELRKELQPAWVRAVIPSFMLKGFVTLTPFLQRLGIRDVFEPRDADLSPMTDDEGVYARDVQQSIGVNIRNYMKPDRTHSRNGLFERAGPVSFVAEHPFLFFIIDAETGVSLIAGRIENPLNSRIL